MSQSDIPRHIHQIWLGSDASNMPADYQQYAAHIRALHPEWGYTLWTDQSLIDEFGANRRWQQGASYAQKADIARYMILEERGGVYLDTDMELLKPMDELLSGISAFSCSEDGRYLGICVLGTVPHTAFYQRLCADIPDVLGEKAPNIETGPIYYSKIFFLTGMRNDFTIFPPKTFYPYTWDQDISNIELDLSESYGIHHYAASWIKPRTRGSRLKKNLRRILSDVGLSRRSS